MDASREPSNGVREPSPSPAMAAAAGMQRRDRIADPARGSRSTAKTTETRRRRRRRIPNAMDRASWSLLVFALACAKVSMDRRVVIFVGAADPTTVDSRPEDDDVDAAPLPASLMKATRVGAKLREGGRRQNPRGDEDGTEEKSDAAPSESNAMKHHPRDPANGVVEEEEVVPHHSKHPTNECHWGMTGCNKGKRGGAAGEANASSTAEGGDDGGTPKSPTSLAGSAAARIEARVARGGRGGTPAPPTARAGGTPVVEPDGGPGAGPSGGGTGRHDCGPPRGFKLAGRVVTSPSDGLSYFLDAPARTADGGDGGGGDDWMTTIPYAYLECGPTIESTTEAFSLTEMVLRHFPASASVGHWTNLGGGVTLENDKEGGDGGGGGGAEYVAGGEGRPRLVVALSPVEITVSGNDEETRVFRPGEVVLMEDVLGKGHKMRAAAPARKTADAHGRDLSVLIVSLPHTVHFPMHDHWFVDEEPSYYVSKESADDDEEDPPASQPTSSSYDDAQHALYGFGPRHLHPKHRRRQARKKHSFSFAKKPCPLEYDSAYSSLFTPSTAHNQHHRRHHRPPRWTAGRPGDAPPYDASRPPPPGYTTYDRESALLDRLPSPRRTLLFGLGLSLASSFVYCVQLLYPPLLVLWGGAAIVAAGALANARAARWGYRTWGVADLAEERRWRGEVRRMQKRGEGAAAGKRRRETFAEEGVDVRGDEGVVEGDDALESNHDEEGTSRNDTIPPETALDGI